MIYNYIRNLILTLACMALLAFVLIQPEESGQQVSSGVEWSDPVKVASGDAHQRPWRMNDSEFHYVDDPAVAIGEDGISRVVWVDQTEQNVFFNSYNPEPDMPIHLILRLTAMEPPIWFMPNAKLCNYQNYRIFYTHKKRDENETIANMDHRADIPSSADRGSGSFQYSVILFSQTGR